MKDLIVLRKSWEEYVILLEMSEKKKKKGGRSAKEKKGNYYPLIQENDSISPSQTIEYLEAKILDLTEKTGRFKTKCDILSKENDLLGKTQSKFNHDKQDIVEFLNVKVGQHEKLIALLEEKVKKLEEENKNLEYRSLHEIDSLKSSSKNEIENLTNQCSRYKAELTELTSFAAVKSDMEKKIIMYEDLTQKKETEHRGNLHNLERKILQNKNEIKREMITKVNEAVATFRRVADQQMAETTKRALRENVSITSQLKKMSSKTIELLQDNKTLSEKVSKLTRLNSILAQTEQVYAKKNYSNQAIIKMLIEKLRESDKMLEFAIESLPVEEETFELGSQENGSNSQYISDLTLEIEQLTSKNANLNDSLAEIAEIAAKINFTIQDTMTGSLSESLILSIKSHLLDLIHKVGNLSGYDIDTRAEEDSKILFEPFQELKKELTLTLESEIKELKSVYCQTLPLPFGPQVTSKYLLGDLRPWGPPATTLPKKGIGMYLSKPVKKQVSSVIAGPPLSIEPSK